MTKPYTLLTLASLAFASIALPLSAQHAGDPDLYIPPTIEVAATTNTDAFRGAMLGMSADEMGLRRSIDFEQKRTVVTRDLLPMIFFDPASSTIPDRYATFHRTSDADDYTEHDELPHDAARRDDEAKYYEVANILGYRMRRFPSTTITLEGSYSTEPGETPEIGRERAVVVKEYLERIWRIDPKRIAIRAPRRGCDSSGHLFRQEEARHVVIESDDWMIHRPVRYYHSSVYSSTMMLHLTVDPRVAPEEVAELTIVMAAGDDLLGTSRFTGSADSSRYRLLCFWLLPRDPQALEGGITFQAVLTLYDGSRRLSAPLTLPVLFSTTEPDGFNSDLYAERRSAYREAVRRKRDQEEEEEYDYQADEDPEEEPENEEESREGDDQEVDEEYPSDAEESDEAWQEETGERWKESAIDTVVDDTAGIDSAAASLDSADAESDGTDSLDESLSEEEMADETIDDAEYQEDELVEEEEVDAEEAEYEETEYDDEEGVDEEYEIAEEPELTLEEELAREIADEGFHISSIPFFGSGDTTLRPFQRMMIERCFATLDREFQIHYGRYQEQKVYIGVTGYGEEGENPQVDAARMATGSAAQNSYGSAFDRIYNDPTLQTSLVPAPTMEEVDADGQAWSRRFVTTTFGDRADEFFEDEGAEEWDPEEEPLYDDETSAQIDSLLTTRGRVVAAAFMQRCSAITLCDSIRVSSYFSPYGMGMSYLPEERFYARYVRFSLNAIYEEYDEDEETEEEESSEESHDETGEREEGMNEADAEEGPDE